MVASRTRKKAKNKTPKFTAQEVKTATEVASSYVKQWAKQEAERLLATQNTPIIVPFKNGYKVGKFTVTNNFPVFIVTDYNNEKPLDFSEKRSAVLYCILYQLKKYNQATDLLIKDQTYAKLHTDFLYYEHCIRRAFKKGDMFTVDVSTARLEDTKHKLEIAKNDLQKTLNQAKYIKIWDNRL